MNPALWFFDRGIRVFPTFNKVPAVPKGTSQFDYRCTRPQAAHFREYGVPLGTFQTDGLLVVDVDTAATRSWAAANIALTPFTVTTGPCHDGSGEFGLHHYFRIHQPRPKFIHREVHTIESRNTGQYVIGPGSVRPDGVVYRASDWSWRWDDIPFFSEEFVFDDGSCGRISPARRITGVDGEQYEFPAVVNGGRRHYELFRLLRSFKGSGIDRATTREIVRLANQNRCQPSLQEDATFEKWFDRSWDLPDRQLDRRTAVVTGLQGLRGL